jgi:hypothetical protein
MESVGAVPEFARTRAKTRSQGVGIREAEVGMSLLEGKSNFSYDKVYFYQSKIQEFVSRRNATYENPYHALVDLTNGSVELPKEFPDRIERWMTAFPELSPFVRKFARYYILSLLDGKSDLYAPLMECVVAGGDFYIENGIFFVRDAARVSAHSI